MLDNRFVDTSTRTDVAEGKLKAFCIDGCHLVVLLLLLHLVFQSLTHFTAKEYRRLRAPLVYITIIDRSPPPLNLNLNQMHTSTSRHSTLKT